MAAEVFDDDDKVIVRLEAPGMDKKEFDLQVIDDVLIVRGEKRIQKEHTEGHYHVKECAYGRFERAIGLPDEVDSNKAQADYKNGILRIELPKAANKRRKRTKVEISWRYEEVYYSIDKYWLKGNAPSPQGKENDEYILSFLFRSPHELTPFCWRGFNHPDQQQV